MQNLQSVFVVFVFSASCKDLKPDHIRHSPSLLRDLAFLSLLVESLSDFMEPVGLFVYCSFSGELSETSALPTIWQMSGELGVREVPIPCRMVAVE